MTGITDERRHFTKYRIQQRRFSHPVVRKGRERRILRFKAENLYFRWRDISFFPSLWFLECLFLLYVPRNRHRPRGRDVQRIRVQICTVTSFRRDALDTRSMPQHACCQKVIVRFASRRVASRRSSGCVLLDTHNLYGFKWTLLQLSRKCIEIHRVKKWIAL